MAKRTVTILVDDIDGTEIAAGAGGSVKFSVGASQYEIDLSSANQERLAAALAPFTASARRIAGPRRRTNTTANPGSQAIREWAKTAGIEISDRGRIPAKVVAQYEAAQAR